MGGGKGGWQGGDEKRINYWKYIQLGGQVRERDEWPSSLVLIGKKKIQLWMSHQTLRHQKILP